MADQTSVLQVRDVPAAVRAALKEHAAAAGTSLNRYLLGVLGREAAAPRVADVLDRAQRRAERARASAGSLDVGSGPVDAPGPSVDVRSAGRPSGSTTLPA